MKATPKATGTKGQLSGNVKKVLPEMEAPAEQNYMIVPDDQFAAGVSLCQMLAKLGIRKLCWPESHRAMAIQCMAHLNSK